MTNIIEERNAHFDRLVGQHDLRWMGQNTNHFRPHAEVLEAMLRTIVDGEFHIYAPPLGVEELRTLIRNELGLPNSSVVIADGGIAGLYHLCHLLLKPKDELITTDPTWSWPPKFAKAIGAAVTQIPIYDERDGYRLSAKMLKDRVSKNTKVIYITDPNNPLGTILSPGDWAEIADVARSCGAYLIHDCTYRDFAEGHTLAAKLYPERTVTIYSFSKWLGLAGLRVGAIVMNRELLEAYASSMPNSLGSSIFAQRAAIAGLKTKAEWFPRVFATQRQNQAKIKEAAEAIEGLHLPIYPSHGNFLVIECGKAGIRPEALCFAFQEKRILIRQGAYHTETFGHRFIKVSTTVPTSWVDEFTTLLPAMVERARGLNAIPKLF